MDVRGQLPEPAPRILQSALGKFATLYPLPPMVERVQILVRGIVQGVGLRPHVYSLAVRRSLNGRILNTAAGVCTAR